MSFRELRRHVGRLAIVGFQGQSVPADLRYLATEFDLGGVIYFDGNIAEPRQAAELSREVADLARSWPLWIGVDQEGGPVSELKAPFTEWPSMSTLGRSGDERLAERFARALAVELRAAGITLDFAPVLDVLTNPRRSAIGSRALAERAEDAARLGRVIIRALQGAGVAAAGKHFPGLGESAVDSHQTLPVLEQSPERLAAVELLPFRAAIDDDVSFIMTAHALVPALDAERPASFSAPIVTGLLKGELRHQGVAISDDLGMQAIRISRSVPEAMVGALAAGVDVGLLGRASIDEQVGALEAVIHAAEAGVLRRVRLDDAMARQRRVKERAAAAPPLWPPAAVGRIGCAEHQEIAAEMGRWQ